MTKPLTLEGLVEMPSPDRDGLLQEWRREKDRLEHELRITRAQLDEAIAEKTKLERSIQILQRQLSPLHRALQAVFGEIELAIGAEDISAPAAPNSTQATTADPRWESFKQTFPGAPARVIDALLAHREMTITQLSALLKAHYDTVKGALAKLRKAGAVVTEGGKHRLAS